MERFNGPRTTFCVELAWKYLENITPLNYRSRKTRGATRGVKTACKKKGIGKNVVDIVTRYRAFVVAWLHLSQFERALRIYSLFSWITPSSPRGFTLTGERENKIVRIVVVKGKLARLLYGRNVNGADRRRRRCR